MPERAVARLSQCPPLSNRQIELLTQLCFRPNVRAKSDLLFNFSTPYITPGLIDIISLYASKSLAPLLFSGGGTPNYADSIKISKPESQLLLDALPSTVKAKFTIYQESTSRNFLENIEHALAVFDFSKLTTITYTTMHAPSGRAYLTLRRFCPHATLYAQTYDYTSQPWNINITSTNWSDTEPARQGVWGEFLRIKLYGSRGDIAYDEVKDVVTQIENG